MTTEKIETFYPKSQKQWRAWLEKNHGKKTSIWLICYKKESGKPTISWSEAVDEALCFGWIDSKRKPIDEVKFIQYFCKRKPKGTWSKINKDKIKKLIAEGRMTEAGFASIEAAKKNGSWKILDEVEKLKVPADLNREFKIRPKAEAYFMNLSRSDKRNILQWLVLAKKEETRKKRVTEVATLANQGMKPKQFR